MAHPIWKDYILTLPLEGDDFVAFTIYYEGKVIYNGKAYPKPSATQAEIKINDICADYLANALPSRFPNTGGEEQRYIYAFEVEYNGGTAGVEFYYDWSYDYTKDYSVEPLLSAPILRKIARNAPLIYTATSGDSHIEVVERGSYSRSFSSDFDIGGILTLSGQAVANNIFNLADIVTDADYKVVVYGGGDPAIEYTLADGDYRYMLYYRNALGGWDFLLVEGKDLKTDTYTRHSVGRAYNNTQARNRGTINYRNDVSRKWQLRTLWLTDEGAGNMHHLLGSVDVYLYDLKDKVLHPVTISTNTCDYKTYSNEGNKLVRYDIEVSLATAITRR